MSLNPSGIVRSSGLWSNLYLSLITGQILGIYIFVLSKRPFDLFKLFNKRPDVQFSMFQYARIENAEKKFTIQQNYELLREKMTKLGQSDRMGQLDEDDFLNPAETLRRQELGLDMDFMVQHIGKGDSDDEEVQEDRTGSMQEIECREDEFLKSIIEPDQSFAHSLNRSLA